MQKSAQNLDILMNEFKIYSKIIYFRCKFPLFFLRRYLNGM